MQTNRLLAGVFETSYQVSAHDPECRHQQAQVEMPAEKSETEDVSVTDLLMKSLFSQEG
jgi:hypothetical protein